MHYVIYRAGTPLGTIRATDQVHAERVATAMYDDRVSVWAADLLPAGHALIAAQREEDANQRQHAATHCTWCGHPLPCRQRACAAEALGESPSDYPRGRGW